jgi:hypothetical protein
LALRVKIMSDASLAILPARVFPFRTALLLMLVRCPLCRPWRVHKPMKQLQIIEPGDGSAFWSGAGEETVRATAQPPLKTQAGQRLRVFVDQKMVGNKESVRLTNVDRGTHEVYAEIVTKVGRPLTESFRVRLTLHRLSALLPP